jgi:hypothetical protein
MTALEPTNTEPLRKAAVGLLVAALAVVIGLRYAQPILDSDLFWHLAYARQMLERHTLVPDPTLYSWTPANHATIYCAWLAELVLYGLWHSFGLPGLFALRYLVIALIAGLFWSTIRRARFRAGVWTLLAMLLLVVTAYPGSMVKPEMFSLLFFNAVLWCYFRAKIAAREDGDPRRWFYAVPMLTLVWANTHGAHVLLAPLLAATAVGEMLSWRWSPGIAFSGRQLAHLLTAWALCGVAVCLTPYGIAYPLQTLTELAAGKNARPDTVWNNAYVTIYAQDATDVLSQPQVFAGLVAAVVVLFVIVARRRARGARVDYALALCLVAYLPLSVELIRASYLWPAFACYALIYLAYLARNAPDSSERSLLPPSWKYAPVAAAMAFAAVALSTTYYAYAKPETGAWVGFGVGYVNPVPEAEYLARAKLGSRFYNTFDSGGYLLWRLYPQYRVMVDPRSFPYLDWFDDQYRFTKGTEFEAFLTRYPADVAIIDLQKVGTWRNFVGASDWHLLFYGPTAAIFARGRVTSQRVEEAAELLHLHSASTAFTAFDFAVGVGDYAMAWNLLDQLETSLAAQADDSRLKRAQSYRAAQAALARNSFDQAEPLFESVVHNGVIAERDLMILTLLRKRRSLLDQGDKVAADDVAAGLARLAARPTPAR